MARPDDGMPDVVRVEHRLRLATPADIAEIETLMKASVEALFPAFYDEVQTASSVRYIASVDRTLVADGTYFVIEAGGRSRRLRGLEPPRQALRRRGLAGGSRPVAGPGHGACPHPGDVRPR